MEKKIKKQNRHLNWGIRLGISENKKLKQGFSLVEMLIATAIFMSIMTVAVTALLSIIDADKKAQAIKSTIDGLTFAVEDMSKDMRMGTNYECLSPVDNTTYTKSTDACLSGSKSVEYINSSSEIIRYLFNGTNNSSLGILTKTICTSDSTCGPPTDLISQNANVDIANMKFYVIGSDHESDPMSTKTQPRVIITASGLISVKGSNDTPTSFNLQTSVSQRVRI